MEAKTNIIQGSHRIFEVLRSFLRKCIVYIFSVTPIPSHIAFIMDGNRRYSKKHNLLVQTGHSIGYEALMSLVRHSYSMGVKYLTVYAFSIENFNRSPEEVKSIMELLLTKIEELMEKDSIIFKNEVKVRFIGNLQLLTEPVRLSAEKAMAATSAHSKQVLSICVAYTSTDEIAHAVDESCKERFDEIRSLGRTAEIEDRRKSGIEVMDIERHMYMGVVPDPDMIVRSSGETRLSNFLLWQSSYAFLYSPEVLWPEIGFWHLLMAIMEYQRSCFYLKKKKGGMNLSKELG